MINQNAKEIKSKLIEIFSEYVIEDINNNPEIIKQAFNTDSRRDILLNSCFRNYFMTIEKCKKYIEKIEKCDKDEQMYRCLRYLKTIQANLQEISIADELIRCCVYKNWHEEDKVLYEEVFEMMTKWNDVFLSYLKREEHAKRINLSYHDLINASGYEEEYKKKGNSINFLAEIIAKRLKERLNVFYDRESLSSGDYVERCITSHCNTSFMLVQLVQREHFNLDEDDNWCYKEYCEFKDYTAFKKWSRTDDFPRLHFLVECEEVENIDELKEISKNPILYKEWCEDIKKFLHTEIKPYFQHNVDSINIMLYKNEFHRRIDDLSRKILKTKKEIILEILDTIINIKIENRLAR